MALLITIEDFRGNIIAEQNDSGAELDSILNYCYQNPDDTKVFKYIDMYDDTILNGLQVKDLIRDISFIKQQTSLMNKKKLALLKILVDFCEQTLKEPHQYLKFHGD